MNRKKQKAANNKNSKSAMKRKIFVSTAAHIISWMRKKFASKQKQNQKEKRKTKQKQET